MKSLKIPSIVLTLFCCIHLKSQEFSKYKFRQAIQINTTATGAGVKGDVYNFPITVELIYKHFSGVAAQDNSDFKTVFNTKEGFVDFASLLLITKTTLNES